MFIGFFSRTTVMTDGLQMPNQTHWILNAARKGCKRNLSIPWGYYENHRGAPCTLYLMYCVCAYVSVHVSVEG